MKYLMIALLAGASLLAQRTPVRAFDVLLKEPPDGLTTHLSVLNEPRNLGDPIRVRIKIENNSEAPVSFWAPWPGFLVVGPDGERAPNLVGPFSLYGRMSSLQPGERVLLEDDVDLDALYPFFRPGRYSIQHMVRSANSNIVHIDLAPAPLRPSREALRRLLPLRPETSGDHGISVIPWSISLSSGAEAVPFGRQGGDGCKISFYCLQGNRRDWPTVSVWVTEERANTDEDANKVTQAIADYLGRCEWGHVYLWRSSSLPDVWPTYREDIRRALELHAQKGESADYAD